MSSTSVLVVDDDRDFAEMMALTLRFRNCSVDVAHSGREAIRLFREKDYDIAFMDVKLPDIDGVEAFVEIRSFRPGARIVLITGYSRDHVLARAVEEGVLGVVQKPPATDDLMRYIEGGSG